MPLFTYLLFGENWGQTKTTELLELSVCARHSPVYTGASYAKPVPAQAGTGMTID
ncbi:MAG: hypothetical protein KAU46_13165 [Candidatus Aminicenantes bacterium]|nr:hypothetical protein [Candidatus Aminicenantes bacterium]